MKAAWIALLLATAGAVSLMRSERGVVPEQMAGEEAFSDMLLGSGDFTIVGPQSQCSLSGDPHVLTFDAARSKGPRWDPMHAPGTWWLIRTKYNVVSVQGKYVPCGLPNGPGWMSARINGVPRTCMGAIAISGSFLGSGDGKPHTLIVKPPCSWNYTSGRCTNADTQPRITWDGVSMSGCSFPLKDPPVKLTLPRANTIIIMLPLGIEMSLTLGGAWSNGIPFTYFDATIVMKQGSAGEQCGHCGNFNGDMYDDQGLYNMSGQLRADVKSKMTPEQIAFCDANVKCRDRLIATTGECEENVQGAVFTLDMCDMDDQAVAYKKCVAAFGLLNTKGDLLPGWLEDTELVSCVLDECRGMSVAADAARAAQKEQQTMAVLALSQKTPAALPIITRQDQTVVVAPAPTPTIIGLPGTPPAPLPFLPSTIVGAPVPLPNVPPTPTMGSTRVPLPNLTVPRPLP